MKASVRGKILTKNLAVRLSPEELEKLQEGADELGISKSEYGRKLISEALRPASDYTRLLLAELCVIRNIMLTLNDDLSQGIHVTRERLVEIVKQAEIHKFAMAEKRIQAYVDDFRATLPEAS